MGLLGDRDAEHLLRLEAEITQRRRDLGFVEPSPIYQRFLDFRKRRDANDPGEPRLAREFLEEIESS